MVTKTQKTIPVFTFSELGEDAKESVLSEFRNMDLFDWADDYLQALKQSLEVFGYELSYYSIDWQCAAHSSITISKQRDLDDLSGIDLYKHIMSNHFSEFYEKKIYGLKSGKTRVSKFIYTEKPFLNGDCFEYNFGEVVKSFLSSPCKHTTFRQLMEDAAEAVIQAGCDDCEHCYSDEGLAEFIEANEYEFTETGIQI
jgi:hypothetical protein